MGMMMTVLDKINEEESRVRQIDQEELADGSYKKLIIDNRMYRVVQSGPGSAVKTIFESNFADSASSVYDAFDGKDRGWHKAFLPRGLGGLEPAEQRAARQFEVYSVGATIADCIAAFGDWMGSPADLSSIQPLGDDDDDDKQYQWGVRFLLDGTGMKAAGAKVPGGYVLTWWK
jgi:hypothetical protein